jgi:heme-degrading monooxygenase HmoA
MAHLRLWRFRPTEGREQDFAEIYSGHGPWSELFGRAHGYLGTSLLRSSEPVGWLLTIDRWQSASDFAAFQRDFGEVYRALDAELEGIAGEEQFVGAFEED